MNEPSQLQRVLNHYHFTLEYVGYDTLPFLPGWSHYEAIALDPELFEHHKHKYAEHVTLREEQDNEKKHVGCEAKRPCLYSKFICHGTCRDQHGLAHTHK